MGKLKTSLRGDIQGPDDEGRYGRMTSEVCTKSEKKVQGVCSEKKERQSDNQGLDNEGRDAISTSEAYQQRDQK